MTLKDRISRIIASEYIFSTISKVLGVILGVVYSVIINRYLGVSLKGEYAVILNYNSLFTVFLCLGMYQAYPRYRKEDENIYRIFIGNAKSIFCFYFAVAIFLFFVLPVPFNLKIAIIISPFSVLIKELNYIVLIENPKTRNKSSILLNILDIMLILMFVIAFKSNYTVMVIFLIIKELIYSAIAIHNLKINVIKVPFRIKELKKYISYGLIPMISTILMTINYKIDVLMLEKHVISEQIGIYSVGVGLAEYVWLIPDALKDILVSKLSKGRSNEEVSKVIRVSLFFCILSIIAIILLGKFVITLLYGKEYEEAYYITVIILIGVIGMIFYKMVYSFNVVNGYRYINLLNLGAAAITNIIGNLYFINKYGIYGAAITSVISYLLCGVLYLAWFSHKTKIKLKDILFIKKQDIKHLISIIK